MVKKGPTLEMEVFRMGGNHKQKEHKETERLVNQLWDSIEEGIPTELIGNALLNVLGQLIVSHGKEPLYIAKIYGQALEAIVQNNLKIKDGEDDSGPNH